MKRKRESFQFIQNEIIRDSDCPNDMIIGGMFSVDVFPMPDLSSIPFCHIYGVNLKELLAITEECFLLKRVEKANKVRSDQVRL
jgi:hypothetical protein